MNTRLTIIVLFAFFSICANAQNIGIGTTAPHVSSALEINSNNKGLLLPRMSEGAMFSITNPAEGLIVYNTTDSSFYVYRSNWRKLSITLPYKNNLALSPDTAFHIINQTGVAITGQTNSGFKTGVAGIDNSGAFGSGVSGVSQSLYGTGVYGRNDNGGTGIYGVGIGSNSTAVYGNTDDGIAGKFVSGANGKALSTSGAAELNGNLTIKGNGEGVNKFLVSTDAAGHAEWKDLIRSEEITIPPAAFNGTDVYFYTGDYVAAQNNGYLYAPLVLPQGATITSLRFHVFDNADWKGMKCRLYSYPIHAEDERLLLVDLFSGDLFDAGYKALDAVVNIQVQNLTTGYYLRVNPASGTGGGGDSPWTLDTKFKGVTVRYTYRIY